MGNLVLLPQDNTSSLPGLTVEGEPSGYPMKDDIADYLDFMLVNMKPNRRGI